MQSPKDVHFLRGSVPPFLLGDHQVPPSSGYVGKWPDDDEDVSPPQSPVALPPPYEPSPSDEPPESFLSPSSSLATLAYVKNLGPLTSKWAQPDHCTEWIIDCQEDNVCTDHDVTTIGLGIKCSKNHKTVAVRDPACMPPTKDASEKTIAASFSYYSPGLHCPIDYTSACTATYIPATALPENPGLNNPPSFARGSKRFDPALHDRETEQDLPPQAYGGLDNIMGGNETAVGCCPSGYGCQAWFDGLRCTRTTAPATYVVRVCQTGVAVQDMFVFTARAGESKAPHVLLSVPMIALVWQSSDRIEQKAFAGDATSKTTAHSGRRTTETNRNVPNTSSARPASTNVVSGTTTPLRGDPTSFRTVATTADTTLPDVGPSTDDEDGSGVNSGSVGVKAGLVVGIIGGALVALGLFVWFVQRYRRARMKQTAVVSRPALDRSRLHELDGVEKFELDSPQQLSELPSTDERIRPGVVYEIG